MNDNLLTDKELNEAWDNAFREAVYFDHKPTPEEIFIIRLRAVAKAQLSCCEVKICPQCLIKIRVAGIEL